MDSNLWSIITKHRYHTLINMWVKQALYNWVIHYPQVVQYPISNDHLKVSIDGQTEDFIKLFLYVSDRQLQNSIVGPYKEGGLKEARNEQIILSS